MLTSRRWVLAGILVSAIMGPGATLGAAAGELHEDAATFVSSMADKAVEALTAPGVGREEREARFRGLLNEHFAVDLIGRWVLGKYWRQASDAERTEYLSLFEDLIVATYVDRFADYSGEQLEITKSIDHGENDALVYSKITRPTGGAPVEVVWRVRSLDGALKVVDVMVEGISMGQTQRAEFASVVRKNGGNVGGLISELRKRLRDDA